MRHTCTFRPIIQWPGKATMVRVRSRFKVGFGATLDLLDRELWYLEAKNVVIEATVRERDIRNDGWLRSDIKPSSPGVILSFQSKYGPLRYPCNTYDNWLHNLRAIALALEALRTVDRYGVTRVGEQYTGWKQLPGPTVPHTMTVEEAAEIVAPRGGKYVDAVVMRVPALYREAYRERAFALHPDCINGDAVQFKRLQEAKRVLDEHFVKEDPTCAAASP
jgi:hypothetical protein